MKAGEHSAACPKTQAHEIGGLSDAVRQPRQLPDDDPSPMQIEIYRRMTPGRRLEVAEQLYWSGRRMKWAWLRTQQPDWTDEQVEAEVIRNFTNARS